jgi:hypothetical protein
MQHRQVNTLDLFSLALLVGVLLALTIGLKVRWLVSLRLEDIERRIAEVEAKRQDTPAMRRLADRVDALETALRAPQPAPVAAVPDLVPDIPPPIPIEAPAPVETPRPFNATPDPEPAPPALSDPVPERVDRSEWEAIVGGAWLNKLGVFVLVIGVALFLGYSFTQMGPAGRAGIGAGVSLAMLASGFVFERRDRYAVFGRGLLGGGWASLYFTAYAMHAVDAAKVISSPLAGAALLLAIAMGMILHSLRYRSETVTGLAYFVAFVTLAITPMTAFSVLALVPLAASLLYVANHFSWSAMTLFGLLATYGTCALHGDSGAPLWSAQTIFSTYWLLFEAFDWLRAARKTQYRIWEQAIFPLNALAFVGLSSVKWSSAAPDRLYVLAIGIAAAYLASAILRTRLCPPSGFPAECGTLERALSGGYEGPITLTAILTAAAVFLKLHGGSANLALLAEAELLFIAGLVFRQAYPRQLAAALFATGFGKLLIADVAAARSVREWTPIAALGGLLFYINRTLRASDKAYG